MVANVTIHLIDDKLEIDLSFKGLTGEQYDRLTVAIDKALDRPTIAA